MEKILEQLTDNLIGSTMYHKEEENIKGKDLLRISADFDKLKSFWAKACFLVYLRLHKNKSIKACGGKIERSLRTKETALYKRHIEPFINEVKRLHFSGSNQKIADKVKDRLMEYGEDEFIILCRVIYSSGSTWVGNIKGVSIDRKKLETLKDIY